MVEDTQRFSQPYFTRGVTVAPVSGSRFRASSSVGIAICRCDAHKVVALSFIGLDFRAQRTPPLLPRTRALSEVLGRSVAGAGNMQRCSLLLPHLDSLCPVLGGRTAELAATTSTEFWPGISGGAVWPSLLRLVFYLPFFRVLGSEPRSIFPFAKVGMTAQRKTSLPDFDFVAFSATLGIVKRACLCSHLHENTAQ